MASTENNYTTILLAFLVIFGGIQEGDSFYVPGAATALAAGGVVATAGVGFGAKFVQYQRIE